MARLQAPEYQRLRKRLERAVERSGASKRALSLKLTGGRDGTLLYHILTGRRSVEMLELIELAKIVGMSPLDLLAAALFPEADEI